MHDRLLNLMDYLPNRSHEFCQSHERESDAPQHGDFNNYSNPDLNSEIAPVLKLGEGGKFVTCTLRMLAGSTPVEQDSETHADFE